MESFFCKFTVNHLIKNNSHVGFDKLSWDSKISYFITCHVSSISFINITVSVNLLKIFIKMIQRSLTYNCRFQFITPEHLVTSYTKERLLGGLNNISIIGDEWRGGLIGNIRTNWRNLRHAAKKKFVYKGNSSKIYKTSRIMLPNIVFIVSSNSGSIADEVTRLGGIKLFLVVDTNRDLSTFCSYFTVFNTKSALTAWFYMFIVKEFIRSRLLLNKSLFYRPRKVVIK